MMQPFTVLLTDRAWPDDRIERDIIEAAGGRLVAGPPEPAPAEEIEALVRQHEPDAIMTCWAQVSSAAIESAKNLQIVTRIGVGLDNIAVPTATERGVLVTNVPDYCIPEVSDHAVGMILSWTRGLLAADREVRAGRWDPAAARLRRLGSLTCGIVGYGRIGQATASKLAAFGCRILANSIDRPADSGPAELTDLPTLLAASDVVILHVPLTPQTHHLIGAAELALMPADSLLVNVSRGGLVDTDALVAALKSGHLSGAALDVLESEPEVPVELRAAEATLITPHIAFSSDVSLITLRQSAAEEVVRVLRGDPPRNPCNPVSQAPARKASS